MIKLIIFDLGGVLVAEKDDQIKKEISTFMEIPNKKLIAYFEQFSRDLTIGNISLLEFYNYVCSELNLNKTPELILHKHIELYSNYCTDRDKNIISLIRTLRKKYKVVALTNTEVEIAEFNRKNKLFNYFERAYISTELRLLKPEPKIYLKVLEDIKCKPNESIFIDDKEKYVETARQLGINAITYCNLNQLKNKLTIL